MKKTLVFGFFIVLLPAALWGVDGQVLINQATVVAAGGFPYKITAPGSYKLSGNLTVTGTATAIEILASNVVLDLNGFSITGPIACSGLYANGVSPTCTGSAGEGIILGGAPANLSTTQVFSVTNGIVQGFAEGIVVGGGYFAVNLSDLRLVGNADDGISLAGGSTAVIIRCQALANGGDGMFAAGAAISDSVAQNNGRNGFLVSRSTLTHDVANFNGQAGISAGYGDTVVQNTIGNNVGSGLLFGGKSLYGGNVIFDNGQAVTGSGGLSQGNNSCDGNSC